LTTKYVFDLQEGDIYACVADIGWITGHSYIVYGPLINGTTTLMFESTPLYPNHLRYWDLVQVLYKYTIIQQCQQIVMFTAYAMLNMLFSYYIHI
jgi:acyl-coenzyme A synthetase/AMP-(fatty) acid ligase